MMKMSRLTSSKEIGAGIVRASIVARHRLITQSALALVMCAAISSCSAVKKYNDYDVVGDISKKDYEGLEGRREFLSTQVDVAFD